MSTHFSINTSQNVQIQYALAGVGDRILAELIDSAIKLGYVFFGVFLLSSLRATNSTAMYLLFLPLAFYTVFFEVVANGQTPGKKLRKIKVVRLDGNQAGTGAYVIRWLFRLVDVYMFYGMVAIVTIITNKKGQRLGDILAGTTVIKTKDRVSLAETLYARTNSNYVPVFYEVKKLEPADVELIQRALNSPEYNKNFELLLTLSQNIRKKMNCDTKGLSYTEFLETVVKDYNYLVV